MALDDDLRSLRTRISQATASKARAQAEHDTVEARVQEADRVLADDFGVTTDAQAKAKLTELKANYETVKADAERALEEAGA